MAALPELQPVTEAPGAPGGISARRRILDGALHLMSRQGAAATSMRQLAAEADLNVATLYYYFPSKAELLRVVIEERHYDERLVTDPPPLDTDASPAARLTALVEWLWDAALDEEAVWRLLVGEALRGDLAATTSARSLVDALEAAFEQWFTDGFPELTTSPGIAARLLRDQVFALVVEHLAIGSSSSREGARNRASDLAALLFR
jgi:AcrR family transcriptional regulator